jgi:hypothetical protein
MAWRRQRKTLLEELREQGAREIPQSEGASTGEGSAPPRTGRALIIMLAVLAASVLVHFAPLWVQALLTIPFLAYVSFRARSMPRPTGRTRIGLTRALFLIWLAVSIAASVLVAIGGFYREDLVLLAVVWTILAGLWAIDRLIPRIRSL